MVALPEGHLLQLRSKRLLRSSPLSPSQLSLLQLHAHSAQNSAATSSVPLSLFFSTLLRLNRRCHCLLPRCHQVYVASLVLAEKKLFLAEIVSPDDVDIQVNWFIESDRRRLLLID
ncbi:hypothetical protein QR680_005372 [Steinernema hermaphroditum]|uniref:Uncharacterized protein n=1 Tax=Steinernema hermaphroditum TaxID=289476 RepID=A0AA39HRR8_9BILA|nr:hypothetical protein QR680_005372 [Steinernema hermaphroditum]